MFSSCRL